MSIVIEPRTDAVSTKPAKLPAFQSGTVVDLRMPSSIRLRLTADDFVILASLNRDLRLEMTSNGELIALPPVYTWYGHLNFIITGELGLWTRLHSGLCFGSSTGFTLPNGACRSPDASWISSARWNALSDFDKSGFARICPDFVVELRSPTDSIDTLKLKMEEYVGNGARLGWLIDPITKSVFIYRSGQKPMELINPETLSGEDVLPGFLLDLTSIFTAKP